MSLPYPILPRVCSAPMPALSTSLRDILAVALQELIEAELTATIGAAPGERTAGHVRRRRSGSQGPVERVSACGDEGAGVGAQQV